MRSTLVRSLLSGAVAVTLSLGASSTLGAQTPETGPTLDARFGRPGMPGRLLGPLFPVLRRLELSDDQRQQVRQILQSHLDDFRAIMRRSVEARRPLFEAVYIEPFDEGMIRDRSANVAAVEADGAVLRARIRVQIFEVLTPDQQARAIELLKRFEHRRREDSGVSSPF